MQKLDKSNIQDILGLTPMQEGMLFHYLSNPEGKQYIEQLGITLSGEVGENIIKKAWDHVILNNDMLRTIFKWDKLDKPVQIILKQYEIPYTQYNLSNINSTDKITQRTQIMADELNKKIDISENPIRMAIIKLDNSKFILIITYHHILYDGWSNGIILKEFLQACRSLCAGNPPSIIRKSKFKEFIKYYQIQDKTKQEAFWREYFRGYDSKSTIAVKVPYSDDCVANSKINYRLNKKISESIYELCKKEKTTVAAILYTAWGILLQKYSNTNDIVFGTTVSGRNADIAAIEDMVGLFINTLPLRVNSTEDENIQGLLKKVDCILKQRDDYQSTPLIDIKSYSGIHNKEELFDTLVVFENYPLDQALLNSGNYIRIEEYFMTEMTNYKLALTIRDIKGLEFELNYDGSIFDDAEINKMARHFENIIMNIIESPLCGINQIDILSEQERNQILYEFNNTKVDYPKDKTIHELFEAQAEKTPGNIAVVFKDKKLTYRELNEKANSLARVLRDKGIKADSIVGIMVERSLEMIIGIMGILKAGGAYLPIDPSYPKERIEYMLKDSESRALLGRSALTEAIEFDGEIIDLFSEDLFNEDSSNLGKINNSTNLAYVIYTSGTTGKPKGAMLEHINLNNFIHCFSRQFDKGFDSGDKVLALTNYVFDVSVCEFFVSLINGSTLVINDKHKTFDPEEISKLIVHNEITFTYIPPSLLTNVYEELKRYRTDVRLKKLLVGVESIKGETLNKFYDLFKDIEIINGYGPTEATICSTFYKVNGNEEENKAISIGKTIGNTRIYILDKEMRLKPVGVMGEIFISGSALGRGYLNRPELTAEKFVDNPFEAGTKMYKTGDLARWLPDGNIEFMGRIDRQVKIRGFRIELGEIENTLLQHESIKKAAVVVKENKEKYICAYVVSDKPLSDLDLKGYLKERLPEYMIPAYFISLEKMPLTPNGKLDRRALPEPSLDDILNEYEAPRNEMEETLARIWGEVLGIQKIGINNNFFELGGHSLKATVLMSKLHKELHKEIPLKELFKSPTIKELSKYIEKAEENEYSNIEKAEEKEYYETSSAQKRMYMLQQFDWGSTAYNMPVVFKLEGELNKERIEETFKKLVVRHDALRTYFKTIDGEIVQRIDNSYEFKLAVKNENISINDIMDKLVRPFDLDKAPLFRAELVENDADKYLSIDMHHIISDGVSMSILIKEFSEIYNGQSLEALKLQYKDFAAWQNNFLKSEAIKKQEEYWINRFSDEIPVLNMPTDYVRPAVQSFEGDNVSFEADEKITGALRRLAKETGSTMHMVLLSAFTILLSKYSGQEDIVVGSPIAGRRHTDLQNIMGNFVNTLALRNNPKGDKKYIDFLKEVKENSLKAYENQSYQFETLVEKLDARRDTSRNPLFDVMFNIADTVAARDIRLNDVLLKYCDSESKISKFDLTLNAIENDKKLVFNIEYCLKLFSNETIQRLSSHYIKILDNISRNTEIKLIEIDILSEQERNQILYEFNNTKVDYPKDKTIHELFEAQAEKTPGNIAVVFKDKKLTYRELNEKANSLARVLRDKGIKADSIVGIMVERSLEMIIGIMGILKAGGAYLPIDPSYPKERIEYMLEDAKAELLIADNKYVGSVELSNEIININSEKSYSVHCENLNTVNGFSDLAYVIYTSGSTGNPKGVMIEHKQVVNFIHGIVRETNMNSYNSILCMTTICFDIFVLETTVPLTQGLKVVIVSEEDRNNGDKLGEILEKNNVEIIQGTPSSINALLDSNRFVSATKGVKVMLIGGEKLQLSLLEKLYVNSDIKIYNVYGPTEATVWATIKFINKGEEITIGKPMSNVKVYIVNNNKLSPIGIPGELCIAGYGLARGYLNELDLTAEKFVESPFEPGAKMYKTGDLARWMPDGDIEFLGRIDNQVKIRGFRIELEEIENKLLQNEDIKQAVVLINDGKDNDRYICAYVVSEREIGNLDLKNYLRKSLPEYMIPTYFIQLEKMSLTHNGKIDRKALPKVDFELFSNKYEAPRNEIEEELAKMWSGILGIEKIGINDNFFELGGHSLKAITLSAFIHKRINLKVSLKDIFDNPTIKELAAFIKELEENIYESIEPVQRKEYYSLSSAQKRMYVLQQMNPQSISYNISLFQTIEGDIDKDRFEGAVKQLISRHESLRTSIEIINYEPVQIINEDIDYSTIYYEADENKAQKLMEEFIKPFELDKAPLFRMGLIKLEEDKNILMFDMHHIITDGVSMNIFIADFVQAYERKRLPELRLQYKDYAEWQNKRSNDPLIKKQENYWLGIFEKLSPVLELPIDFIRGANIYESKENEISFELDRELAKLLKQTVASTGVSLYILLLAIYNVLLCKYCNEEDIVVGTAVAGRTHADLKNIIGMFTNMLPIRNYPEADKTFFDFLMEVKYNTLQALDNQEYQFETLVSKLKLPKNLNRNPLFDTVFQVQNAGVSSMSETNLKIYPNAGTSKKGNSRYELVLSVGEQENNIYFNFQYCTTLYMEETIKKIWENYTEIMRTVLLNNDLRIEDIEIHLDLEKTDTEGSRSELLRNIEFDF